MLTLPACPNDRQLAPLTWEESERSSGLSHAVVRIPGYEATS